VIAETAEIECNETQPLNAAAALSHDLRVLLTGSS
jgi:hypothetical protein